MDGWVVVLPMTGRTNWAKAAPLYPQVQRGLFLAMGDAESAGVRRNSVLNVGPYAGGRRAGVVHARWRTGRPPSPMWCRDDVAGGCPGTGEGGVAQHRQRI